MRSFIAIDFDAAIRRQLAATQDRLRHHCPSLRWVDPEKIHLTLKFLGEIDDDQLEPVARTLDELTRDCRSFDIAVRGLGVFGTPRSVRVVWVGLHEPQGFLARCHARCETLLLPLGFPKENRPFRPHLTLARNRSPRDSNDIRRAVEKHANLNAGIQTVTSITLYQSTLTSDGPIYQPLSQHPFPDT